MTIFALFTIPFLLAGCRTPPPARRADPEIERHAAAAQSAYAHGALESAAAFYEKALNRARQADLPPEIARLAYNLAACRARTGQYGAALALLDEAQYEAQKDRGAFPEASLLRAEIFRGLGKTNEAAALAESEIKALKKSDPQRLPFQLFLAEQACDQNDGQLALAELNKLDRGLLKSADSAAQAREAVARGRALLLSAKPAEAAGCFDQAAGLYQNIQRYKDMGNALYQAGAAYAADQKAKPAFDRYFRAARILLFCGDNKKAPAALKKASALAQAETDRALVKILSQLKPPEDSAQPGALQKPD